TSLLRNRWTRGSTGSPPTMSAGCPDPRVTNGRRSTHCAVTPECFHHRGPARNLRRDKGGEIPRRANSKLEAELFHAGHHLGRLQRRVDRGVELVDDVGGSCGRRPHPGPEFEREFVEPELPHGGHVGQIGIAFLARYGQRLDPALANERPA